MLKRISVADLRLGMHLHALDGSWLAHPFWRTKFVLSDPADLAAVQGSGVGHCWIDPEKGLDVSVAQAPAKALAAHPPAVARVPVAEVSPPNVVTPPKDTPVPPPSTSFEEELHQAARLAKKSKHAVQQLFGELRMGKALNAEAFEPLVEELTASVFRNPGALVSLVRLKTKDDYSYMHSVAVCALMISLARASGFGSAACREAGLAGLLHDVGKALMPLDVLNKPGKLTDAEFDVIRSHPERGHALLVEGGTAGAVSLDVCLHHHERFDGTGYPEKLAGQGISALARMGAICDVYDAISSNRPYKAAWDPADSISKMASWGGHFDPTLFALFVKSLGIYPTGSLVRLRSGKLAVVVKQHPKDLTAPTVKVFFSTKSNMPITVAEIDLSRSDIADSIVSREPRGDWNFPQIDGLWAGDAGPR
jgi:HD-GYP domain-containing protein (c-di-GMP phosphodiesterase class II)